MDDFEEMLTSYPEMILLSKYPPQWKGLITVRNNCTGSKMKVQVKLVLPAYPRWENASIYFGNSIAFLFGKNFKSQIDSIMKNSESVVCFFQELTTTLENLISNYQDKEVEVRSTQNANREKLLKELSNVLSEQSDVEISSTKNLSAIKLTMSDISIVVQPTATSSGQNSWKIISSDLPELPNFSIDDKKSLTLKEMRNMFEKQVDTLEGVWEQLSKIDKYCWVTDPINPKPYHMYRRIYLSPSLSFLLTLNPLGPTEYPRIKFLGVKSEVEKYIDKIENDDVEKWDLEYSVHENLLTLLDIDEFPQPPKYDEPVEIEGMVGDDECCICFSMELDDGELPNEICGNQSCRRRFHSNCLFQWLQELPNNKIVFNQIFGSCPNCSEQVSCTVPST